MPHAPSKPWSLTHASDQERVDYKAANWGDVLTDEIVAQRNLQEITLDLCGGPLRAPGVVIYDDTVEVGGEFLKLSQLKRQSRVQITATLRSTIRKLETKPIDRRMLKRD